MANENNTNKPKIEDIPVDKKKQGDVRGGVDPTPTGGTGSGSTSYPGSGAPKPGPTAPGTPTPKP
jgi:hypothetical protein